MSQIQIDIQNLEMQIKHAKEAKEQKDRLVKLRGNPDFRSLITEGFCRDETARYCHESTDSSLSAEDRADCLGYAQAGGYLKRWIHVLIQMGELAESQIPEMESTLEELRAVVDRGEE